MSPAGTQTIQLPPPSFTAEDFPGAVEIRVPRGRFILFEDEEHAGHCYLILQGEIDVRLISGSGHETLLYTLGEGDIVGELGLFGCKHRTASILTRTPCRLLKIAPHHFERGMDDPGFMKRLASLFLRRYQDSHEVIRRLGQPTIPMKLCRYLLSLPAWESGGEARIRVKLPSHNELGHMLSCQRESVTRAFRILTELGVLTPADNREYWIDRNKANAYMRGED